ncbi:MAG: hypothetical protein ACK4OK_05670 [Thermoflexus sp.]
MEEGYQRLEEAVSALAEAQRQHYEEFVALRREFLEYRAETERRFAALAEAVQTLTRRVDGLNGRIRGWELEERYRTRPYRYEALVQDPEVLDPLELARLVRAARRAGRLSPQEAFDLSEADVIVRGYQKKQKQRKRIYLVVEVSATVDPYDVERAAYRARLLEKALRGRRPRPEVRAVVAGPQMFREARTQARVQGVWWLKDSCAFGPHEIKEEELSQSSTL